MAERRMFTKKITDSDAFIELSSAAQALYLHLNQSADDDGFTNQVQMAMFKAHASIDDLKVLLAKRFLIQFESGVIVIKHWRMHNTLRKDRYTPTNYQEELDQLGIKENGAYTLGCQTVAKRLPQVSKGKDSIGEGSVVEGSVEPADGNGEDTLKKIGKGGVVYLSDQQVGCLLDKMGIEAFDVYFDKLERFIIENGASVKNHYKTILKWYEEDTQV